MHPPQDASQCANGSAQTHFARSGAGSQHATDLRVRIACDFLQHEHSAQGVRERGDGSLELQPLPQRLRPRSPDRKSTRLNSSHSQISYAVFCLKKKKKIRERPSSLHTTTMHSVTY